MSAEPRGLPPHVHDAVHHPEAMRALRAVLGSAPAAVMVLRGAVLPEALAVMQNLREKFNDGAPVINDGQLLPELAADADVCPPYVRNTDARNVFTTIGAVGARVAGVEASTAVDLARARARAAAAMLETDPPAGRGWVLVLDAGQRCAVLSLPRGPAPTTSPERFAA